MSISALFSNHIKESPTISEIKAIDFTEKSYFFENALDSIDYI